MFYKLKKNQNDSETEQCSHGIIQLYTSSQKGRIKKTKTEKEEKTNKQSVHDQHAWLHLTHTSLSKLWRSLDIFHQTG